MNNYANCIDRIKDYAKNQGITMKYLCDQLGRQRSFLANVRNGSDNLKDEQLDKIATILHTTPEYLKGETDDPTPADSGSEEWMDEIKISPHKLAAAKTLAAMSEEGAAIINGMSQLSVEDLLKVEQIIDMIKGERS